MLIDKFNRKIDYLRISVTDRCNLRCIYCMPECGIINRPHEELLTFEEIARIVKAAVNLGIDKIRITGGEPLVRKGIVNLIGILNKINGLKDISLTTNGILLEEYAAELKEAGLSRVNISLDSLRQNRYEFITRQGKLTDALQGLEKSLDLGFSQIKLNVLLLDCLKEDEIADFLKLTIENEICVRFLEFMPVNSFYKSEKFISCEKVLDIAKRFYDIEGVSLYGSGPAKVYKFKNALGSFGLISPMSNKFCLSCNRLRLTSDGFLRPCLHSSSKVNLKYALRNGAKQEELISLIKLSVKLKPKEHTLDKQINVSEANEFSMCQIGG